MTVTDEDLSSLFHATGPLATLVKGFEARKGQADMASDILHAFEDNKVNWLAYEPCLRRGVWKIWEIRRKLL